MREIVIPCLAVALACPMARAQEHTERGALLGGLSGALIGAAVGQHNGEAAGGALIGSAIGLFSGAALGNTVDKEEARIRANQQYQRQAAISQAVSLVDVVRMAQSGVSDAVIMNQIRQRGVQQRLQVPDVIYLHQQGVSEPVISCMQQSPVAGTPTVPPPVAVPVSPVIVERHYHVPRVPYWGPRYYPPYHHGHHGHHHPGVRVGFSFGR